MKMEPVGEVRKLSENEVSLDIAPEHQEGLQGIRAGDQLQVLYWMHKLRGEDRRVLKVHPQGDASRPLTGVFGVRSPMRPNPIGVSTVTVTRLRGRRVFVIGLDALDGSPIMDIKGTGCGSCVEECPNEAMSLRKRPPN